MRTIGIDLAAGAPVSEAGFPVDRAAEGRLFEVYPGGSLRLWGFDTTGYRARGER
ncbi:hypothetical protein [Microbacterium trichothecenolyticum]|uniref:Uncharacterized protein n=1 Tax=Microbacterium trichothecenolyticum TaxID=69370 RepID=A0ABU0TXY2_MICTR|nr:hypothetical protein [Microbacterium trichothecenolyticum]MDQ1123827.1 hypothetical protein [Microbacterium trichothecenolyticum]